MDGLEARLTKIEKRVRACLVMITAITVILAAFFGWMGYNIWKYWNVQERIPRLNVAPTSAPLMTQTGPAGTSLFTAANDSRPYVSLIAKEHGWALQLHAESGFVGENDEMSLIFRVSEGDGTPTLSLIGKNGAEVWHAP